MGSGSEAKQRTEDREIQLPLITHSDKYFFFIKGDKYLFFIKVGAASVVLKLNYLQSRIDTVKKGHICHTKQYQTFYREIKCDFLNIRGVPKRLSIFDPFYSFFHQVATLMESFIVDKLQSRRNFLFRSFMERPCYTLKINPKDFF